MKRIKDYIKIQSHVALSSDDIMRLLKGKTRVMSYRQFMKKDKLDEVLKPFNSVVILYEIRERWGHWTAIIKRNNIVEFFDPYGYLPDDEFKFIPKKFKEKHYPYKHLVKLLLDSGYDIHYNNFELQSKRKRDIATCGRWVVWRILLKDLNEHEFKDLMVDKKKRVSPDDLVTIATLLLD